MIKIDNVLVYGWDAAIRGMRNPMNSWEKSDSHPCLCKVNDGDCAMVMNNHEPALECDNGAVGYCIGKADYALMNKLAKSGTEHAKYLRMITVTMDITAPLYWWKEYDTYKVGTVANSCSTMHKIHSKEFTLNDFSTDHLYDKVSSSNGNAPGYLGKDGITMLNNLIKYLNWMRERFIATKDKAYWWQMIQLLPSSYNQMRTIQCNYQVLANIYHQRKAHKLDEWREFCRQIESLPCSELITDNE